ncbi:MAG: oligoendopeptidase F family protein, partial [bacterium]|nr:oligoendopeptidase F family protein [bacterium]
MSEEIKKNIPDFSNQERKEVPQEFKWKVEDVYPSIEAWEK